MTTAQSSFIIAPHNYLLNDPSRASRQQVRIDYSSEAGVSDIKTFGGAQASGLFNLVSLAMLFLEIGWSKMQTERERESRDQS